MLTKLLQLEDLVPPSLMILHLHQNVPSLFYVLSTQLEISFLNNSIGPGPNTTASPSQLSVCPGLPPPPSPGQTVTLIPSCGCSLLSVAPLWPDLKWFGSPLLSLWHQPAHVRQVSNPSHGMQSVRAAGSLRGQMLTFPHPVAPG